MKNTGTGCRMLIWAKLIVRMDRITYDVRHATDGVAQRCWLATRENSMYYIVETLKWYLWRLDRIEPQIGY